MTFRQATDADAPVLAAIMGDWFESTVYLPRIHTPEQDLRFTEHLIKTQDVLVSGTDTPTGFIARAGDEIGQLYLASEARGQGQGNALLDAMKQRTDQLALWCFQQNTDARRFYEHNGFVVVDMTDGQNNEEKVPDVRYVWERLS